MTLAEAIAEVKRIIERGQPLWQSGVGPTDTILNAVASGTLIPASDVPLAVALAYQRAAARIEAKPQPCSPAYPDAWTDDQIAHYESGQLDAANSFQAAILALAPADALAEVRALRFKAAEHEEAFAHGVAYGQNALRQMEGKAFQVVDSPELHALRARAEAAEAEVARLRATVTEEGK